MKQNKNAFTFSEFIVGFVLLAVIFAIIILKYSINFEYNKNLQALKNAQKQLVYFSGIIQEQHPYWSDAKGNTSVVAKYYEDILPKNDEYMFYVGNDKMQDYCKKGSLFVSVKLNDTPVTYDAARFCIDRAGNVSEHLSCTIDDYEHSKGKICKTLD